MISLIICSHHDLAESLIKSAEMIIGETDICTAIALQPTDDIIALSERIKAQYEIEVTQGRTPIILTDIPNASPYNAAIFAMEAYPDTPIVAGVNLPLVLELILMGNSGLTLAEIDLDTIVEECRKCIMITSTSDFLT